jgi:hypothetical protein
MTQARRSALKNKAVDTRKDYRVEILKKAISEASETVKLLREAERVRPERLREPVTY